MTQHKQHPAPNGHTGQQEASGPGHRKHITMQLAGTPVNRSQGAHDTAHATQGTEQAYRQREPSHQGHRTRNTMHRAGTPVNRSQVAHDSAHTTQCTKRAHWLTGAKLPRKPHTKHNTPSVHTGEQEASGPGHRTHSTTHRACTLVNSSQVAQDTAHATMRSKRAHWRTGPKSPRAPHTQRSAQRGHTGEQEPGGPGHSRHSTAPRGHTGEQQSCGPGHRTHSTTHRAGTPVNRS